VSIMFSADGASVWFPGNRTGRLFKGVAEAVAAAFDVPSGLGEIVADEVVIDVPVLERFLKRLAEQYDDRGPVIASSLTGGVLGASYVLVERAGGQLPEMDPQQAPAWKEMHSQFSRSMPR
jgi:hypothetical protein